MEQKHSLPDVDIARHDEPGYKPLLYSDGDWLAALMNGTPDSWRVPDEIEQHPGTDELFVLVSGRALMIVAGNDTEPGDIHQVEMERNVLYNVKAATWHTTPMSEDGRFLIIEKKGTESNGSNIVQLTDEQKAVITIPD